MSVNIVLFSIGAISLPWLVLSLLAPGGKLLTAINLLVFVSVLLGFVLQWGGNTDASRWLLVMAALVYWVGALLAAGPFHGTEYFIAGLVMLPVLIFSRAQRIQMLVALILTCLTFILAVALSRSIPPLLALPPATLQFGYHINALFLAGAIVVSIAYYKRFAATSYRELEYRKQRNDQLVSNFLPPRIAQVVREEQGTVAEWHPDATVLFIGLTGFSALYSQMPAIELVEKLAKIYARFDALVAEHGVEKVKTLGTSYVAATGIGGGTRYAALVECALAMRAAVLEVAAEGRLPLHFYGGVATGLAISGVMAGSKPRFDVWGEALEGAIRMRELADDNGICINDTARWRLGETYVVTPLPGHEGAFRLETA